MELEIKDVSVYLQKKQILQGIHLTMKKGVYGVLGENGAGKTTLFRTILGLQKYQGEISFSERKSLRIGYVPQQFDTLHGLNLTEILTYFCCLKNIKREEQSAIVETVLKEVHLDEEKHKKVGELSGGMLRRLGIAQALLNKPELLIMDEPTVGLDPEERMNLREIIKRIQADRILLVSSHEIYELENVCQNIIFLHKGQVRACDTLDHLYEKYQSKDLEKIYFELIRGN